jgi:hypothetical protein
MLYQLSYTPVPEREVNGDRYLRKWVPPHAPRLRRSSLLRGFDLEDSSKRR